MAINNSFQLYCNKTIPSVVKINIDRVEDGFVPQLKINTHYSSEETKLALMAILKHTENVLKSVFQAEQESREVKIS